MNVQLDDFSGDRTIARGVPVRRLELADGTHIFVATAYDLLMAQYGVDRGLGGDAATSYDDEDAPYTPAWQERYTGLSRDLVIKFAREWGSTAELTRGKCKS